MTHDQLCMGCMSEKPSGKTCDKCGYDETRKRSPLILPHRTILNNRFVAGRILGKPGGFGVTYLGWDMVLETRVAIKEYLPRDLVSRESNRASVAPHSDEDGEHFKYGLDQFLQEARTLAKFNHASVVRVRDFFQANETAYMIMDFYEGVTLAEYLDRQGGKIPEKIAVDLMMPVLDGLREVHEKGFLHRDVKPHNIYLTRNGMPILLDFGATRFAMGERSRSLSVVLTPGYAPYEQYHRKGKQGPWTDIYACGATLYTALTGQTPPEATERMIDDELTAPDTVAPGISPKASQAVMRCLEKNPKDRPGSVRELQNLLMGGEEEIETTLPPHRNEGIEIVQLEDHYMIEPRPQEAPGEEQKFPDEIKNSISMTFRLIQPGTFMMGSPEDEPGRSPDEIRHSVTLTQAYYIPNETRHQVTLTRAYYMQTTPVTQGQWKAVMDKNPSRFKKWFKDVDDNPVERVSWKEVQEFIKALNKKEGTDSYRLPTEAEWEYVCRAGTDTPFSFGNCLGADQANYNGDYPLKGCPKGEFRGEPSPVANFPGNPWGFYDMHGNVSEWCQDWYRAYSDKPIIDPNGPSNGSGRVARGGGWYNSAAFCRSAYRHVNPPGTRIDNLGFRLVRVLS